MLKQKKKPILGSQARTKSAKLNLTRSLFQHGKIQTSLPKARQLSRLVDRLVSRCRTPGVKTLRYLEKKTGSFQLAKTIYNYGEVATKKRTSGFCSIRKIGLRQGDSAVQATISLIDFAPKEDKKKTKGKEQQKNNKKIAVAEKKNKSATKTEKKTNA